MYIDQAKNDGHSPHLSQHRCFTHIRLVPSVPGSFLGKLWRLLAHADEERCNYRGDQHEHDKPEGILNGQLIALSLHQPGYLSQSSRSGGAWTRSVQDQERPQARGELGEGRGWCDLCSQLRRMNFRLCLYQRCQHGDTQRCRNEMNHGIKRGSLREFAGVNIRERRDVERLDNQAERQPSLLRGNSR